MKSWRNLTGMAPLAAGNRQSLPNYPWAPSGVNLSPTHVSPSSSLALRVVVPLGARTEIAALADNVGTFPLAFKVHPRENLAH